MAVPSSAASKLADLNGSRRIQAEPKAAMRKYPKAEDGNKDNDDKEMAIYLPTDDICEYLSSLDRFLQRGCLPVFVCHRRVAHRTVQECL